MKFSITTLMAYFFSLTFLILGSLAVYFEYGSDNDKSNDTNDEDE